MPEGGISAGGRGDVAHACRSKTLAERPHIGFIRFPIPFAAESVVRRPLFLGHPGAETIVEDIYQSRAAPQQCRHDFTCSGRDSNTERDVERRKRAGDEPSLHALARRRFSSWFKGRSSRCHSAIAWKSGLLHCLRRLITRSSRDEGRMAVTD